MTDQQQDQPRTERTVGSAVAERDKVNKIINWVEETGDHYGSVLPTHLEQQHWIRLAAGLLKRNQDLAAAAVNNPDSLRAALMECARLGHEPGTDQYALVPIKDKDTGPSVLGIEQYQGEIERMYRAGAVTAIICEVIYEGEQFSYNPGDKPFHQADWLNRGDTPLVGVYAYAVLGDGVVSNVVVMGKREVDKHRAVAKTDSIWRKWPEPMWRKTAVHELEKWVPTSAEFQKERLRALAEVAAEQARPIQVNQVTGEVLPDREVG